MIKYLNNLCGKNSNKVIHMRTFSEINHNIRKCKQNIENASSKKEYFQCLALLDELECEKDRVWSTL